MYKDEMIQLHQFLVYVLKYLAKMTKLPMTAVNISP